MTIQQLQYVLEISRTGSVSKAAKTLYLSQPNLSNAIKNLENELGITIFERTPMGMQLTASGMKLAKKATSIMADIQEITSGISAEEDCLFRLVYPRYVPAFEAFWDLCTDYQEMAHLHFSCYIGDGEKQVEALYRNLCDLVIYLETGSSSFARLCSDLHVKFVKLKDVCFYVQLAENHPLLQKPHFDIEELKRMLNAEHYTRFYDFKKKVLEIAMKEIADYTDLDVTYTLRKKGKQFTNISFSIGTKHDLSERLLTWQKINEQITRRSERTIPATATPADDADNDLGNG